MIRSFDLSIQGDMVNQLLNDPYIHLHSLKVNCSEETAYTVCTLSYHKRETPRETRFNRFLARYEFIQGGHPEADKLLDNPKVRLLNQHLFPTSEGVILVLDYQVRKGR